MAQHANLAVGYILGMCTPYFGSEVTITVPRPGTIVVSATVLVQIAHTTGTVKAVALQLGTTTSCGQDAYTGYVIISSGEATDTYVQSVPLLRTFAISASGTYTFNVYGVVYLGGSNIADQFLSSSMVAVFYPG